MSLPARRVPGADLQVAGRSDPPVYRPDAGDDDPHFLRDLVRWAESRDPRAGERLDRYRRQTGSDPERRDVGTSAFGALVVPQFLVDLAAGPVRPGDPLLSALEQRRLPPEGLVMTVPRSATTGGSSVSSQTENSAASETDPSLVNLQRSVVTAAGQVTVTDQLLDRSPGVAEPYLARDLLDAANSELDRQLISGVTAGGELLGLRNVTDRATVTWTDASPTRGELVGRIARTAHDVAVARQMSPDLVILHPRRWYWLTGALADSSVDAATLVTDQVCASPYEDGTPHVGSVAGLPVVLDANVPTTVGAGTNEDVALVIRAADMPVLLSSLTVDVDRETDAGTREVTLVGRRYAVWFPDRYRGTSVGVLTGTGLVAPGTW